MIIKGTGRADHLLGTPAADRIYGFGGDDLLFGDAGDDAIYGGKGDDQIHASGGNDRVFGGAGLDNLFGGDGFDELHGGRDGDFLSAGLGGGVLYGDKGEDYLILYSGRAEGGTGNDTIQTGDYALGGWLPGPVEIVTGRGSDSVYFIGTYNEIRTTAAVLDFGEFGHDRLELLAYQADGAFLADGATIKGLLDRHPDGVLDEKDTALGAAVFTDEAADTITLGLWGDRITLHGLTALPTDFIT